MLNDSRRDETSNTMRELIVDELESVSGGILLPSGRTYTLPGEPCP